MRQSVTQEFDYGCGIACYAFALGISYKEAESKLGKKQSTSTRFFIKDLTKALNNAGKSYHSKYVKPHIRRHIYEEGAIVLIKRSTIYRAGHYLIRHEGRWMDPWINLPYSHDVKEAKSGFRQKLPGSPLYVLLPK